MTTEVGKRLLEAPMMHWSLCGLLLGEGECDCRLPAAIAAIEAEAVAARNAEIAGAVRGLEGQCHDGEGLGCDSFPCSVNVSRAAVLAIIEGKTP